MTRYFKKKAKNWLHGIWLKLFDDSYYRILNKDGVVYTVDHNLLILFRLNSHSHHVLPIDEFNSTFHEVDRA